MVRQWDEMAALFFWQPATSGAASPSCWNNFSKGGNRLCWNCVKREKCGIEGEPVLTTSSLEEEHVEQDDNDKRHTHCPKNQTF